MQGARDAAATAKVDVEAALAWRDYMVSNYSDAQQERWLANAVTYSDPQAAAVGAIEARFSAGAQLSDLSKTATYTHAYAAEQIGILTAEALPHVVDHRPRGILRRGEEVALG
jgi:hypothetical protein